MYMIILVSGCVLVVPTWVVVVELEYGIMAAWVAATVYVILLGFVFYLRFLQGKWKTMKVIEEKPFIHPMPPSISECPDTKFEP
jgi:multidrug resistance protein, MATE family